MRHRIVLAAGLVAAMVGALIPGSGASARPSDRPSRLSDVRHVGSDYNGGRRLPLSRGSRRVAGKALSKAGALAAPVVGDDRVWLGLDDAQGEIYAKTYRLRGVGNNIEVWTAHDSDARSKWLNFQRGDCRNGVRSQITNAQVEYLIQEFDGNIYPEESAAFSVPPARDGTEALLDEALGLPQDYYVGDGDKIVVLIDNVRDGNFYDLNNTNGSTYIAGFFFSVFNDLVDRNVMTIDGFDWLHRTGANPPDDPAPGNNCTSAPARPFLYEGVFAHEYQHLLEHYEDPDEVEWVNEGLADWAQTLTGYVDPSTPPDEAGFDSHTQCFLGHLGVETPANPNPREGGPENSLTRWSDQGAGEILCDYGAAYTIMELFADRFGNDFMRALHTNDLNGFEGLDAELSSTDSVTLLHQWAAMVALDGVLDAGATLTGGDAADYQVGTLDATINWATPHAYSKRGAPPNGSDYVRLRDAQGAPLDAADVTDISFAGDETLPPVPVRWRVDRSPPQHKGRPALYSGSGPNFDKSIVRRVLVPADKPRLTFLTKWNTEGLWDYAFVQVSTDGGETWDSLANADTNADPDPGTIATVHENLPGFTGNSGGWKRERFNLSAYAGQRVHLSFRYVTDSGVDLPGWWIDKVMVGDRLLSRGLSVEPWRTATQVRPFPIEGYTVQLISYTTSGSPEAHIATLDLTDGRTGTLTGADVAGALGSAAEVVAAIVTFDESTERFAQYAPYVLTVNGVVQPGG